MPNFHRAVLAGMFILLTPLAIFSQEGSISIESKVDRSTIRIGDLIKYTILVTRTPDVEVEMPGLAANLGSFEIRDYEIFDSEASEGQVIDKFEYTISTFDVGEFEIPPLEFYYIVANDTTKNVLKTRKIKITVESIVPSEAGDIRDVKSPLEMSRDLRRIIIWSSIGFAVLLLTLAGLYVWRRKKAGRGLLPKRVEPPRPAHEVALEQLKELETSSLLEEGKVKKYYIEISEIIRRYIEGRFFIVALELTTFELLQKLESENVEAEAIRMIQEFLESCDLAKFAKYVPAEEKNRAALSRGVEIVEKTMLVYEEPAEEEQQVESHPGHQDQVEFEQDGGNEGQKPRHDDIPVEKQS